MSKRWLISVLSVVTLVAFTVAGCSSGSKEPIKIGAIAPLSGGAAMVGDTQVKGIQLAIDQVNAKGGIKGRKLELIAEDDEQNPAKSVNAANKLVYKDKVIGVIGTVNSSATLANMEVTKKAEVPQITPISSNPKITRSGNPWIFRLQASDTQQAQAIVDYAIKVQGLKRLAVLYQADDYGTGGKDVVVKRAQELGSPVVAVESYNPGAKDMTAQLLKIKEAKADGLVIWGMYPEGALIARQAKQMDFHPQLMGGGGLTNPKLVELAGDAVYGLLNTQTFFPDPQGASPEAKAFIEAYKAKYGVLPDSNAAMSYDSMMIMAKAIEKAGTDKKKIRDEIAAIKGYRGVTGVIDIDQYGDANREILIIQVMQGGYKVVWPKR